MTVQGIMPASSWLKLRPSPQLTVRRRCLPPPAWLGRRRGSTSRNVVDVLEERGLLAKMTSRALRTHLDPAVSPQRTVYLGIDPSARSLHVGNLLAVIGLLHFVLQGHRAIALVSPAILSSVGGATGSIGDPSGRSAERPSLDGASLDANVSGIRSQILRLVDSGLRYARARADGKQPDASTAEALDEGRRTPRTLRGGPSEGSVKVLDNRTWLGQVTFLDFLRDVGKHFRVSTMLSRESVSSRIGSESGISFTEFSYQLLQAYDFATLHAKEACSVQLGGSDQEGNIVGGIDFVRKVKNLLPAEGDGEEGGVYGLMMPLLTTSDGAKFGKSAGNAIWLDAAKTPPVDLFQAFVRTADADVERYLRALTFVPVDEIDSTMREHRDGPHLRKAQDLLATEITRLVHGDGGLSQALLATSVLFNPRLFPHLSAESILAAFQGSPHLVRMDRAEATRGGEAALIDLLINSGLSSSKGDARKALSSKSVTVNHIVPSGGSSRDVAVDGRVLLLKRGKTTHKLVELVD